MLKPTAFANAAALATIIFYLALLILKSIAPIIFRLIINSQFLGADIASQVPPLSGANFLGILIATALTVWIFGYLLARIYNRFVR